MWTPSIKLLVAQYIFADFNIEIHEVNGSVVYYSASLAVLGNSSELKDKGLTNLCLRIVQYLLERVKDQNV